MRVLALVFGKAREVQERRIRIARAGAGRRLLDQLHVALEVAARVGAQRGLVERQHAERVQGIEVALVLLDDLRELSARRVVLAVGHQQPRVGHARLGGTRIAFDEPGQQVDRLRAALGVVLAVGTCHELRGDQRRAFVIGTQRERGTRMFERALRLAGHVRAASQDQQHVGAGLRVAAVRRGQARQQVERGSAVGRTREDALRLCQRLDR